MRAHRLLRSLTKALASGGLAALVAAMIEHGVRAHLRQGNLEIAVDSLGMLWVPAVFALVALLFLGQALFQGLGLLGVGLSGRPRSRSRCLPPRFRSAPAPAPAPPTDPYRQACSQVGVAPGSSWAVIRAAWRRHLPHWHADRGGDPELWHRRLAAYRLLEARRAAPAQGRAPSGSPAQALKALRRGIG